MLQRTLPGGFIALCLPTKDTNAVPEFRESAIIMEHSGGYSEKY